ncbi:MAG TPA: hypothetical protein VJ742_13025 [Nitrososphaera sp.]|nr:hypothetical protein [Nitrososphaera sp.]
MSLPKIIQPEYEVLCMGCYKKWDGIFLRVFVPFDSVDDAAELILSYCSRPCLEWDAQHEGWVPRLIQVVDPRVERRRKEEEEQLYDYYGFAPG